MKKTIISLGWIFVFATTAACSNSERESPSNIAVEWLNASLQKDQSTMLELIDQSTNALDPKEGAVNDLAIENYTLTEWKANDERYFYEIVYEHPDNQSVATEQMEVIKNDQGEW
ncbi:hypothetical protein JMA_35820 [Jeotgalibacillus malaysiensis]|uniref:DUF4878 domain-containing protein n=1 Tax=Jeotgalibacillus malaysiensis TaxID=1508404 RepID=A0A0B5AY38_9BACL|nr:hypothetical protein [Jeotgalibacillus malaysiensis]AJD92899.1 hypothetical protein JMA_35820 [Jeotgalibacillus malaysiensis]